MMLSVRRPGPRIGPDFSEAVDTTRKCCKEMKSSVDTFACECVHVHPLWMESSDNTRMVGYEVPTFVKNSVLVGAERYTR